MTLLANATVYASTSALQTKNSGIPFSCSCAHFEWPPISSMPSGKGGRATRYQRHDGNTKMTSGYYVKAPCLAVIWKLPTLTVPIGTQEGRRDSADECVTHRIRQQAPKTSEAVQGRRRSHQGLLKGKRNPLIEQHTQNRAEFGSCQTGFTAQKAFTFTLALRELGGTARMPPGWKLRNHTEAEAAW